ncbi:MAG: hypothetical protein ABW043_16675 [Devosia sp.]|uniref:hypothetical protein n=1 Tax=Devosia sp. TaxID=1871048 RepID=UPI00339492CE
MLDTTALLMIAATQAAVSGGAAYIPPPTSWRVLVTGSSATVNAVANSTLATALLNNASATRPTVNVPATQALVMTWDIDAVSSPGAFVSFIADKSAVTWVAEQSTDGGSNWTALTGSGVNVFPSGGTTGSANTRQLALIGAGAARKIRVTITGPTGGVNILYPGIWQRQANDLQDMWLILGASLEVYGCYPNLVEDALRRVYPAHDPVVMLYAATGAPVSDCKSYPAQVEASAWGTMPRFDVPGNVLGNTTTIYRPYSSTSGATRTQIAADVAQLLTAFPGRVVLPVLTTFRAYTSPDVTPSDQSAGSLDFNLNFLCPAVQAYASHAFDAALGIPRVDLYSLQMRRRVLLGPLGSNDAVHPYNQANGSAAYDEYRAELVRTAGLYAYTGAWPAQSYTDILVQRAVAFPSQTNIDEAGYALAALPSSAAKTAYLATLAALTPTPQRLYQTFVFAGDAEQLPLINAESGHDWTTHTSYTASPQTINNRLYYLSGGNKAAWSSLPAVADVPLKGRFRTMSSSPGVHNFYLAGRMDTAANTMVVAGFQNTGRFEIATLTAGTLASPAAGSTTTSVTLTPDTDYDFEVTFSGTSVTLKANGVVVATATVAITAAGRVGVRFSGTGASASTGAHLVNIETV